MAAVDRKRLSIQDFSPEMQDSLRALDLDGSGSVDSRELARAAEAYRSVQARAKRLNRMLAFGAVVLMLTLAAFSGLVFAVVEMTKESRVSDSGVLMVKGSNETVKTSQVLNKSTIQITTRYARYGPWESVELDQNPVEFSTVQRSHSATDHVFATRTFCVHFTLILTSLLLSP